MTQSRPLAAPEVLGIRQAGFSLIEVMIVMVVVAILAAIALPAYNDSVRKSRRSDAHNAIAAVQQAQERWRGNNPSYTTQLTAAADADPPGLGLSGETPGGYYDLSIVSADAQGYVISAVGKTGTTQADDTDCRRLAVRLQGGNLQYAGCGSCDSYTFATTHACWAR